MYIFRYRGKDKFAVRSFILSVIQREDDVGDVKLEDESPRMALIDGDVDVALSLKRRDPDNWVVLKSEPLQVQTGPHRVEVKEGVDAVIAEAARHVAHFRYEPRAELDPEMLKRFEQEHPQFFPPLEETGIQKEPEKAAGKWDVYVDRRFGVEEALILHVLKSVGHAVAPAQMLEAFGRLGLSTVFVNAAVWRLVDRGVIDFTDGWKIILKENGDGARDQNM